MEFTKIIETVLNMSSSNLTCLCGAVLCTILTAIVKKCFLDKLKIDLLHTFDPSVILPFVFGVILSAIYFLVNDLSSSSAFTFVTSNGMVLGALSTIIYKIWAKYKGSGVKELCKDDVFNLLYTQMLALTDAKKRLLDKTLSESEFIGEIQTLTANAKAIYQDENNLNETVRQEKLKQLFGGIIDDDTISKILGCLGITLSKYFDEKNQTNSKTY